MMKISHAVAGVALTIASIGTQAANLVVNGSFEEPLQSANDWSIYPSIPGWVGDDDIEIRNDYDGVAQDGVNFAELDTFDNGSISQTIFATGLVRLSFWYSPRANTNAPVGSHTIGFSFGNLSGVLLENAPGLSAHDWREYVGIADLGTSGSAVLTFSALGISDQFGGSLDNVSVTAVPLPGALLMLLSGGGLLGLARRRRA